MYAKDVRPVIRQRSMTRSSRDVRYHFDSLLNY